MRGMLKAAIDSLICFESSFHKRAPALQAKKRILILRKDGLGDCIIFYPTLAAYREFYKNDEMTLVFPIAFKSLSPLLASIENVIWFDAKKFSGDLLYRRKFLLDLHRKNFDIAIYPVFSREAAGDMMMRAAAAKETIGFRGQNDSLYNKVVSLPETVRLEIDRDMRFAESITGKKIVASFPTIDIKRLPNGTSDELIRKHSLDKKQFVIVFPGAGEPYKIWQPEKFAAIIDYFIEKDVMPVVCGNERERDLVKEILVKASHADRAVDLSGQTDLPTMAHLLARSKLYFGSDTGILHLAVALEVPSIALAWEGSFGRFFPYGDPNRNVAITVHPKTPAEAGSAPSAPLDLGKLHPSVRDISVNQAIEELEKMERSLDINAHDHE